MQDEFLTQDHWLEILLVNVDNEKMTDSGFREFVRHNLPTVIGHGRLKKGLTERGRLPKDAGPTEFPIEKEEVLLDGFKEGDNCGGHAATFGDFRDRPAEQFKDK